MRTVQYQKTLADVIELAGIDEMCGCPAYARIAPGAPDTGYVLETPNGETFRATLDNATEHAASIMIRGSRQNVLTVEHMFATLYAHGISNAHISVWRQPGLSLRLLERLGLANTFSLPLTKGRETMLCEQLRRTGVTRQDAVQRTLTLTRALGDASLRLAPCEGDAIRIQATTRYPVPGEQRFEFELSPEAYGNEIAWSRPYGKILRNEKFAWLGLLAFKFYGFPEFGIGHGIEIGNFIWHFNGRRDWEDMDVARHTCVDRLGAIALLDGRLAGVLVTADGSGHAHDLAVLRRTRPLFAVSD